MSLNRSLVFVGLILAPFDSGAVTATRVPVRAAVCFSTQRISNWTYSRSHNITNGVPDRRAYLTLSFEGIDGSGGTIIETQLIPVKGLVWDQNFKDVIYRGGNGATTCATQRWYGQSKDEKTCLLTGVFRENDESVLQYCPRDGDSTYFDGVLIVQ